MATNTKVAIHIIGKADSLNRATNQAEGYMNRLNSSVNRLSRYLVTFGTAVITGIVIRSLTRMVKSQMEVIDTTAKLSDRIGMSTEALSAYQHAGKIAGLTNEQINKGFEIFIRRLGEVTQGTGEAKYGLDALDLELSDLINKKPDEAFKLVAERIRELPTQAQKAAAAYRFFGRSGSQMLNLMEQDLGSVIAEAERLGITFSRLDAAKVEAANDAMTRMRAATTGITNSITIGLAPMFEVVADRVANLTSGNNNIEKIKKKIEGAAIAATYLVDAFEVVRGIVNGIIALVQKLMEISMKLPAKLAGTLQSLAEKLGMDELAKKLETVQSDIEGLGEDFGKAASKNFNDSIGAFKNIGAMRKDIKKFFAEVEKKQAEVKERSKSVTPIDFGSLEKQKDHLKELQNFAESIYDKTRTPLEKYRVQVEKLDEALKNNLITQDTYNRALAQTADEMEKGSKSAEKLEKNALKVGDAFASAFGNAIIEGQKLSGVLNGLAEDLTRIMINRRILGPLANAIDVFIDGTGDNKEGRGNFGKFFGSLFGQEKHKGGIVTGSGIGRMVPASAYVNAPRFHNGFLPDEVPAILKKGEGVFTPAQMAALGSGGDNFNMNLNLQVQDTQSGLQFIDKMARPIANKMYQQMRRNHRIRRSGR